jgi:hypothetical protein
MKNMHRCKHGSDSGALGYKTVLYSMLKANACFARWLCVETQALAGGRR